jgi:regulator of CtrA degradation
MPALLVELLGRSARLYERVLHLDRRMFIDAEVQEQDHPVRSQLERLQAAFGR